MTTNVKIIRGDLPQPCAVIIRNTDGSHTIVADHTLAEATVQQLIKEAPTLDQPTHTVELSAVD